MIFSVLLFFVYVQGMGDSKPDVQMLCHQIVAKVSEYSPGGVLGSLDALIEPLEKTCNKQVRAAQKGTSLPIRLLLLFCSRVRICRRGLWVVRSFLFLTLILRTRYAFRGLVSWYNFLGFVQVFSGCVSDFFADIPRLNQIVSLKRAKPFDSTLHTPRLWHFFLTDSIDAVPIALSVTAPPFFFVLAVIPWQQMTPAHCSLASRRVRFTGEGRASRHRGGASQRSNPQRASMCRCRFENRRGENGGVLLRSWRICTVARKLAVLIIS